ncbi:hypothetical protein ACR77J_11540 [Tissierella praeacuta]|uniref:hypothetical protein n=1 Tax=Tissierella praeacuta TaxID=43131 RepID=UPI003DA6CC2C
MKKNNLENNDRENRTLKAVMYIRVGSIEQLSLEAEQRHFNLKVESLQKGEESDATSSCNKEKGISYMGPVGI